MQNYIDALKKSIADKNWYGGIIIGLTMPDICGKIEYSNMASSGRYAAWFDKYVSDSYAYPIGPSLEQPETWLSGNDCYALRCSMLHEGSETIAHQRIRERLKGIYFTASDENPSGPGFNLFNNYLQVNVMYFLAYMISGLEQWLKDINNDPIKMNEISEMLQIHDF